MEALQKITKSDSTNVGKLTGLKAIPEIIACVSNETAKTP